MHISADQQKVISLWIYIDLYKKTTQLIYLDKSTANKKVTSSLSL